MSSKLATRFALGGCILILLIQVVVQIRLASLDSQTTDEAVHLSAGYTYLTRNDFRFNPEHPPLAKELAALPLLIIHPKEPAQTDLLWAKSDNFLYDSWRENRQFGEQMMFASGNNPDQLLFWARIPIVVITLLLGLSIMLIAWRHWGAVSALVAIAMYSFNPTINGHGHLVTTDLPLALGFLLAVYSFWMFLQKPTFVRAIAFGASLALAMLFKHTAMILAPILLPLAVIAWADRGRKANLRSVLPKLAVSLAIVWLSIWVSFGFHSGGMPAASSITAEARQANGANDSFLKKYDSQIDKIYNAARPGLSLLPRDYLKGLFLVSNHASSGQSASLLGQESKTGWWYYFPVLFFLKTPLAALLAITGSLYLLAKKRSTERLVLALMTSAAVFLLVAMLTKANLGVRHIMPVFPLLFLVIGWGVAQSKKFLTVTSALLIWLAIVFGLSFPNYLGYFNELAGGSNNGYRIAADSNLDWGQDLKRISSYIKVNNLKDVYIEYGWDGVEALDYYLGKGSYRLLRDWRSGEKGYAVIGASAYNQSEFSFLRSCADKQLISPGTIVCRLGRDR